MRGGGGEGLRETPLPSPAGERGAAGALGALLGALLRPGPPAVLGAGPRRARRSQAWAGRGRRWGRGGLCPPARH